MSPEASIEREVKLDVGLRFTLPDLNEVMPGVVATPLANASLQATYIDTADLRLMRWGVTLRYRRDTVAGGSGESGWTLKLPSEAEGVAMVRTELSWPGKLGPVPPEVASMVRAQSRTAPLGPVARLNTERRRVELRDESGAKLAELDDDVVSVLDGRRLAARFRQVEFEVTDAATEVFIVEVLNRLGLAGAVAGDDRPKVVRALGPRASLGPDVVIPELSPKAAVETVVAAAIAAGLTRMIRHDPGVRLGDDPEHVHQARVGTRRLRSDLWTFRPLLDPDWVRPIRTELGWLAAALGEVRDADVLSGRLRSQIRSLPGIDARPAAALLRRLALQRDRARATMLAALNSQRYVDLLEDLARAASDPPLVHPDPAPAPGNLSGDGDDPGSPHPPAAPFGPGPGWNSLHETVMVGATMIATGPDLAPVPGTAPDPAAAPDPPGDGGTLTPGPLMRVAPADGGPGGDGPRLTAVLTADGSVIDGSGVVRVPAPTEPEDHEAAPFPMPPLPVGEQRAADVLPALVHKPWKQLRRAVDALGDDPADEALHEIRILAKRVRYAAEAVVGVVGKPARAMAVAVADVQGVLGDMQDAVVAEDWLRAQVSTNGSPARAMVAGELVTLQRQQQADCRRAWKGPWKVASRRRLRAWIEG